jgi:hypothetical protein
MQPHDVKFQKPLGKQAAERPAFGESECPLSSNRQATLNDNLWRILLKNSSLSGFAGHDSLVSLICGGSCDDGTSRSIGLVVL